MKCAVFNCKSDNKCKKSEFSFYSFPKDKALLKKWVFFCHRSSEFNVKTARICMKHFIPEDIENNIQFEMGFCSKRTLKPGCVPSLNEDSDTSAISKARNIRIQARNNKQFLTSLLLESNKPLEFDEEFNTSLHQYLDLHVTAQSKDPLRVDKSESSEGDSDEREFLIENNTSVQHVLKIQKNSVQKDDAQILPKTPNEQTVSEEETRCYVKNINCPNVEKAEILKKYVDRLRLEKFSLEQSEKRHATEISALKKRLETVERDKNILEKSLTASAAQHDEVQKVDLRNWNLKMEL